MIRLPGDPVLEAHLVRKIAERLKERRQSSKEYSKQLQIQWESGALSSSVDKLKFQILHRQFSGRLVPGLPMAVSAARFCIKTWRRWR